MKNEEMIEGYWIEKSNERLEGSKPLFVTADVVCEEDEEKMIKTIKATFKLRGTEKEIERVKSHIAAISAMEEVISLYMGEEEQYLV